MIENRSRIAVLGAGVSGVVVAWLLSRRHDVVLVEKEARIGGHARTVTLDTAQDHGLPIDTGFIVFNDRTYPTLIRFFQALQVATQKSDMSFGYHEQTSGFFYSSDVPRGLFARRRNLVSPTFWAMLRDIKRFYAIANRSLVTGLPAALTLRDFIRQHQFSEAFVQHHLLPMSAAIWSTPAAEIDQFPAQSILKFYQNHGLLSFTDHPQWYTVTGGSQSYLNAFERAFQGRIIRGNGAVSVSRESDQVRISLADHAELKADYVVVATHPDSALTLLTDPSDLEQQLLSQWRYIPNQVDLHTDVRVLPPRPSAWASWNYLRRSETGQPDNLGLSYYMNRLQSLPTPNPYIVSLNMRPYIPENCRLDSVSFDHPSYTRSAVSTQARLGELNNQNRTFYCGAYHGYGFHEDGARSGAEVAKWFNLSL